MGGGQLGDKKREVYQSPRPLHTFLQVTDDELQLWHRVDADQVGLHPLAGLLGLLPVLLLGRQPVAARLEGLPPRVTLPTDVVRPRVCHRKGTCLGLGRLVVQGPSVATIISAQLLGP